MSILSVVSRIEHMHLLIKTKSTGPPAEFARRVGISRRSLFAWLDQMKEDFDFPIAYDPLRQTYYYTLEGHFEFGFKTIKSGSKVGNANST